VRITVRQLRQIIREEFGGSMGDSGVGIASPQGQMGLVQHALTGSDDPRSPGGKEVPPSKLLMDLSTDDQGWS